MFFCLDVLVLLMDFIPLFIPLFNIYIGIFSLFRWIYYLKFLKMLLFCLLYLLIFKYDIFPHLVMFVVRPSSVGIVTSLIFNCLSLTLCGLNCASDILEWYWFLQYLVSRDITSHWIIFMSNFHLRWTIYIFHGDIFPYTMLWTFFPILGLVDVTFLVSCHRVSSLSYLNACF